jgi:hypothetical protein
MTDQNKDAIWSYILLLLDIHKRCV